jgi:predicted RNase H-related nuclease YkuK (DUF458 family)
MNWRTLGTLESVDLTTYVKNYLNEKPETEVFVGTDSQNTGKMTHYAYVVVLYTKGKGGHAIYAQEALPRIKDDFQKLWREVELSVLIGGEIETSLQATGIEKKITLDLDLNPDPRWRSNNVMRAALGWGESLGFAVRYKPFALAASYVADKLVKTHKPANRKFKGKRVSA